MAEKDFITGETPAPAPKPPRRKGRLALAILGVLLILGILLILTAPTLIGSGPVVSILLGQVNKQLNGKVDITSLSLGWFSGVKVEGVRVFDASNAQIAELDHVNVPLPLWKAALGKLNLGDVAIDGLSFDARYDAQGKLNFSQLKKQAPPPSTPPSPAQAPPVPTEKPAPSKLPDITGNIKLTNCHGTISRVGKATVYLTKLDGEIKIPNIAGTVTDQIDAAIKVGDQTQSSITASGSFDGINAEDPTSIAAMRAHQSLDIQNLDLQTAGPFIPDKLGVDTLQGLIDMHLSVDVTDRAGIAIDAAINAKNRIAIGGRILKGDIFSTDTFVAQVPTMNAEFSQGLGQWQSARFRVGVGPGSSPILFKIDQGQVTLLANLVPQALVNWLNQQPPGSPGQLVLNSNFDLGKIIPQLKNTVPPPAGVSIDKGTLTEVVNVAITPEKLDFSTKTDTTQITGTQTIAGAAPNPLAVDPVHFSVGANGTLVDLQNIGLSIESKFANGKFHGDTIRNINGNLTADLTVLQSQISQFIDLKGKNLSGTVVMNVSGVALTPAASSTLDKLQSAHWQVNVSELAPLLNLASTTPTSTPDKDQKQTPPLQFTSGSLALAGDLSHEGPSLKLNVSQLTAQNLAFKRGDISYAFKPINLNLTAAVQPDGLQVTQLAGDLGIATLSMPAPVAISQMSTKPVANGGIKLVGNLTDLTQLLAALQGQKPEAYPYRGDYTLAENIGSQQSTVSLKGGLQIAKFQSFDSDAVTFSEDLLNIANDVALTTEGDDQSVAINSVTAAMQSSGAANLALTGGTIQHLKSSRDMQLHPAVEYDLAKLWPIIQPMMGDKYKTLKIAGHYKKQFYVSGSYPANQPLTIAIKPLHADGDLAVESFDYNGLTLQNFIVPFDLDNGQLITLYANKSPAAPATANGGTLDLSHLTIDLTQDPPRLTTPANKTLVNNLTINPLFSDSFLAKMINNPLFAGAKDASGLFALTVDDCTNLPMGNLVTLPSAENTGKIDLHFSITKLNIGLGTDALQSVLKQNSFEANVKDATVAIAKGISTQHIKFVTGDYTLGFDGSVRLKDQAFIPMTLTFPLAAIASKTHLVRDQNVLAALPDSLAVPVEGTVSAPKYRFEKIIPQAVTDATAKAIAGGLLGGNKNSANGNNNSDPLGGLLNKLQKKKKKDSGN